MLETIGQGCSLVRTVRSLLETPARSNSHKILICVVFVVEKNHKARDTIITFACSDLKFLGGLVDKGGKLMKHTEGTFLSVRDTKIYFQSWLPEGDIKAAVLIAHGINEHSGRYMNVVNHLVPLGYGVYGYDHIGHGKSEGERVFVRKFEDYTETLNIYLQKVKVEQSDKPVFLIGHSMGGMISCYFLLDHSEEFRGAIMSGPVITIPENSKNLPVPVGKVLSKLIPKVRIMKIDANGISRDPKVVKAFLDDPLVFKGRTPLQSMLEMLNGMIRINQEMEKISLPLFILHGSEDPIISPEGSNDLFHRAGSEDKTLKIYEGLFHEPFNEPEHKMVLSDVAAWLDERL